MIAGSTWLYICVSTAIVLIIILLILYALED